MTEYKASYNLSVPISICRMACVQTIKELKWQLIEQRNNSILTKRPSSFWWGEKPVMIQITFESKNESSTMITYHGSMWGIGPIVTSAIERAISNLQRKMETLALSTAFGYLLVSRVTYLGGHPLMPNSAQALIGLSAENFVIHLLSDDLSICSIPLLNIGKLGTGRPKTAREVYSEDGGYTIDVIAHSPFLSIAFELDKHSYTASFEAFSEATSQEWANQITAIQYKLRQKHAS